MALREAVMEAMAAMVAAAVVAEAVAEAAAVASPRVFGYVHRAARLRWRRGPLHEKLR